METDFFRRNGTYQDFSFSERFISDTLCWQEISHQRLSCIGDKQKEVCSK